MTVKDSDNNKDIKQSAPDTDTTEDEVESHLLLDEHASVHSLEKIYEVFAASARRWEAIVYPALIAFIILAVYGFYLIFSLTTDVNKVVIEMRSISGNMVTMTKDINEMSQSVVSMRDTVKGMQTTLGYQLGEMQKFNALMVEMNNSMHIMTAAMDQMRMDMGIMNRNVSRPMNFMNSFMPW